MTIDTPHDRSIEARYFNRDISWLEFNRRVLAQASDETFPLLERVKFLSIFSSNLDEFFMKRVGLLKRYIASGVETPSPDGRRPTRTLAELRDLVKELQTEQARIWLELAQPQLTAAGVHILRYDQLDEPDRDTVDQWYRDNVFPILTPLAVDPGHKFPFISNLSENLGVLVGPPDSPEHLFARIKIPDVLPRFVDIERTDEIIRLLPLDELIRNNLDDLFPGMTVHDVMPFRLTRNASIQTRDDESDNLYEHVEAELQLRRFAEAVRIEVPESPCREILDFVLEELMLGEEDAYARPGPLEYQDLFQIASLERPELKLSHYRPVVPAILADDEVDIFALMRERDILLHHPYESFKASVERFIAAAARDPDVLAIKQTIYRTSRDSPFVVSLIRAAEEGKQVACLVELRARFDEQKNLRFARQLEKHGVHVAYGVVGLKTHCKCSLVVRRESHGLRCYAHVGTGNYNPTTAQLYTDHGLLTCNPRITADVVSLFNLLTGRSAQTEYNELIVAPTAMRARFEELIGREIHNARAGKPARIFAKFNSLEDIKMTERLYEASQAGVPIDLVVRGFCCLRPGVPDMSENIRVWSIIGRFLEHSRFFHFADGHEDPADGVWIIGSGDWMYRNLNARVEAACPVYDRAAKQRLCKLRDILTRDQKRAWDLQPDGTSIIRTPLADAEPESPEADGAFRHLMHLARARYARLAPYPLCMTDALHNDIQWLHALLDEVAPPPADADHVARAARDFLAGGPATERPLRDLPVDHIHHLLKRLAVRFHLRNKAEQLHIARVNRRRELDPAAPRPESIRQAVRQLADRGLPREAVLERLAALDIQPTLTAHPTETRRRAILAKQQQIADCLAARNSEETTPAEHRRLESHARQTLALLLTTDEIRAQRLDVIDEVRNGLHHLTTVIWDAVPTIARDIADAIEEVFGQRGAIPPVVRYRSWIGGDRDGNPFVTAEVTRRTLAMMHDAARELWINAIERLRRELTASDRRVPILPELVKDLERESRNSPVSGESLRHLTHEPFRVKLVHMRERVRSDEAYTAVRLRADLDLLRRALDHAGLSEVAARGKLADAIVRAEAFGLHLAALDIRQHSRVHEAAVTELFAAAGVCNDYAALDEDARLALLCAELTHNRPLLARDAHVSDETRELLDVLELLAETRARRPDAIGSYIISMTHQRSDLLEVLVLMREVGLWRRTAGGVESALDVAPLFETVEDLAGSSELMRGLFADPAYAEHLRARDDFQEIMLGYSDSNKDGGYWMANWRLRQAQHDLAQVCTDAEVTHRFFHGRGGTVARGGGCADRAIISAPPNARTPRIRFTEQGEVITFRYTVPAIARRHLEQIVNAMLLATGEANNAEHPTPDLDALMDKLSAASMCAYRGLVDRDDFWPWFLSSSPVLHIGELPIASRPVSRAGAAVTFDTIRAIPWVFSWTQMRLNVPGWYGLGTAFEQLVLRNPDTLEACRLAYAARSYFATFIDNAQQEMARARLAMAAAYGDPDSPVHALIAEEFERARRAVLQVTGQSDLLDNNPVIQQSIRERNPDTDLINTLQVELLHRCKETEPGPQRESLQMLVLLSVNALAAAMQSTG